MFSEFNESGVLDSSLNETLFVSSLRRKGKEDQGLQTDQSSDKCVYTFCKGAS